MKLRYITITLFTIFSLASQAQDFHNTYWQFAPVEVNPAFTGAFLGNLRVNAIGRNQGTGVANGNNTGNDTGRNSFDDLSIAVDGSLPFGLKETDWISVGLNISRSTVGAGKFNRNFAGLAAAYHLSLNKDQTSVFTLGARYGSYTTSLGNKNFFSSPFSLSNNNTIGQDIESLQVDEASEQSANDFMVGVMYTTPVGKKADLRIGISTDHLLSPRLGNPALDTIPGVNTRQNLDRRFNVFAQYYVSLSNRVVLNPTVLYMSTANANVLLLQGLISYLVNPEKDFTLNGGIGWRVNDNMDIPIFLGADWKDWRFGLTYDTNVIGLTQANGTFGAIELGATKVINWEKKAVVKPKYVCPRL
jgi:type IX secretion system PorP/SprF family membrane protein